VYEGVSPVARCRTATGKAISGDIMVFVTVGVKKTGYTGEGVSTVIFVVMMVVMKGQCQAFERRDEAEDDDGW